MSYALGSGSFHDREAADWLDRRISEVVALGKRDRVTGIVVDDVYPRPSSAGKIVVAMKLRMDEHSWASLKSDMQAWVPKGIEGKFMARYESDHPQWYAAYTPSIEGNIYHANNVIEAQQRFAQMAALQNQRGY